VTETITVTADSVMVPSEETEVAGPPRGIGGSKAVRVEAALAARDVRALTDLAEGYPDDAPMLRIVGRVLEGWGENDLARLMFERALELAPGETQTSRELQLLDGSPRNDPSAELQVEVMWDANYTDVDLRVVEPSGEEVSYQHMHSKSGGTLHEDVTDGYGPETYTLPRMEAGTYQIVLDYYNEDDTSVSLQTLVHVIVYVRGERRDYVVVLTGEKERIVVATVRN